MSIPPAARHDLETLLRSRLGRRLVIAAGVLLLALLTSLPVYELVGRQRGVPLHVILLPRLLLYGLWGILLEPLLLTARWLRDRSSRFSARALLLVPFTVLVAAGMTRVDEELSDRSRERVLRSMTRDVELERERPRRSPRRAWRPDEGSRRQRWWERGQSIRAFSRSLTEVWLLLAIGASIEAFLRGRESERATARLALHSARIEAELARAQVGSLTRQLHPHFLFNALHSVGGLVRIGDDQRALAVLSDVAALLRLTLEHGERQEQTLRAELAVTERYLALEGLRLGDRLRTRVDVEEAALEGALPSLLLLPIVENAVRHGIAPREEGGVVEVRARRVADELHVEVRDDGPGFPETAPGEERSGGIGLANGRERLALLYGDAAELRTQSDGGARVTVVLPWHTLEEES